MPLVALSPLSTGKTDQGRFGCFMAFSSRGTDLTEQRAGQLSHSRKSMTQFQHLYGSRHWRRRAALQLKLEPLCRMCLEQGRATPATVADHVDRHHGDANRFFTVRCRAYASHTMIETSNTRNATVSGVTSGLTGGRSNRVTPANAPPPRRGKPADALAAPARFRQRGSRSHGRAARRRSSPQLAGKAVGSALRRGRSAGRMLGRYRDRDAARYRRAQRVCAGWQP